MRNFDRPYVAASLGEFWRRWHISLSTWFRDYLYIPLGGNRNSVTRTLFNILIVFTISGLWHGANWTFIVWGAFHGIVLCIERLLSHRIALPKVVYPFRVFFIFHLVVLGWVVFRATSLTQASFILQKIFSFESGITIFNHEFGLAISCIVFMELLDWYGSKRNVAKLFEDMPRTIRWLIYSLFFWLIYLLGVFGEKEFIYFVF